MGVDPRKKESGEVGLVGEPWPREKEEAKEVGVWRDIVDETGDPEGERPGLDQTEAERLRPVLWALLVLESMEIGWEE
jgi:hypothetical protein